MHALQLRHIRGSQLWRPHLLAGALATPLLFAACAAQQPAARVIDPSLHLTPHLSEGTSRWRVTASRDTAVRELGVMTSTISFVGHEGVPAVLLVSTFPTPRGNIVDSALVLRETLAPVWQRSHQPTKMMRLAFSDSGVTGEWAPTDSSPRAVNHRTTRPVFDATAISLVLAALPYEDGYEAILPMYTFELGGMELDTVRVQGRAQAKAPDGSMRDAWELRYGDPFITSTIWIDRATRRILRRDIVSRKTGVVFRQVPLS